MSDPMEPRDADLSAAWGAPDPAPALGSAPADVPSSEEAEAAAETPATDPTVGLWGAGPDVPETRSPLHPEPWAVAEAAPVVDAPAAQAWSPPEPEAWSPPEPEAWSLPEPEAWSPPPVEWAAPDPAAAPDPWSSPPTGVGPGAAAPATAWVAPQPEPIEPLLFTPPAPVPAEPPRATSGDDSGWRPTTRPLDGRLARVHLRGGLLTLARASLEQMAGIGALDREALVDLAEARWRSGDLEGAAEAAQAHLNAGGDEPLAHLIVAEEADRKGSLVDARRHAAVVRERVGTGLDRMFAGEPRSTAWPMEAIDWMDDGALGPGRWGLLAGGREVAHPEPSSWRMLPPPLLGSPLPRSRPAPGTGTGAYAAVGVATGTMPVVTAPLPPGPPVSTLERIDAGRAAGVELDLAESEIELGDLAGACERLALVLRFDPVLAPVVLSSADRALAASGGRHPGLAAIHLLRGDAYRALGREMEAMEAYQESLRAIAARGM